ncbi:TonB-dependent receptor [Vandammella animalimorsus]|uniref:TonB-dependent siderophore receptor n=1 Tax=Vandammella animalimorsus TaxID=2029117 RepID=A0A2A2A804_9BURK|nr:TonB-dependent siderophore receptor [Vandammella animalimorsus]PAT33719.1 TonB-dependent siderophore receptor [Vandammella animalimorsus]
MGVWAPAIAQAAQALPQVPQAEAAAASQPQDKTLPAVTVTGQAGLASAPYAGGQVSSGGRMGLLGERDFMETPFATIGYTEQFIAEQALADVQGVIARNDPAVSLSGIAGEHLESYFIRGFAMDAGDVSVDGLAGMGSSYRNLAERFERIEVLKGPAAMLGGMPPKGSVGGAVNLVPKRAGSAPLTRLTAGLESDAHGRAHLDLGRRFGASQQWGVRLNAMARSGETAVDTQKKQAHLGALALDWRGPRARVFADFYRTSDRLNGMTRGLTLAPGLAVPQPPRATVSWNPPWAFYEATARGATLRGEFDVSGRLTAWAAAGRSTSGLETMMGLPTVLDAAGSMRLTFGGVDETITRKTAEAGLKGQLRTGSVGHQFALHLNHFDERIELDGFRLRESWTSNIHHPAWGPDLPRPLQALSRTQTQLRSLGLADTLSFMGDRVQLTLGLRRQQVVAERFNAATGAAMGLRYDQAATTPVAAVLLKATQRLSLYANYAQGLSQGATAPATAANAGEVFAPYKSTQKELGFKFDQGEWAHTLSLYQIERPSGYVDPVSNVFSFGGLQRNRGVEWGFFGAPAQGWRLMGGIAHAQAEVLKAAAAAHQGRQATGLSKWQAKLGAEWDVPALPGLTLSAHANYASRQYLSADNALSIPGRTVFDLGARYATHLASYPLTLRASVANAANKTYWAKPHYTSLALGAPRSFQLSATVDF